MSNSQSAMTLSGYNGWDNSIVGPHVGIEIEVEGTNLPTDMSRTGWSIHRDGSLRGESAEYVFTRPLQPDRAVKVLDKFRDKIAQATELSMSYRTSVHVHVNVRDMSFNHIYNMILLYTLYEDMFGRMAGDHRMGNLFCLRMKDAKGYMDILRRAAQRNTFINLGSANLRYSACNPVSMFNHGTLEFRAMRGTTDVDVIKPWMFLLLQLREAAQSFHNPTALVDTLNSMSAVDFTYLVFNSHPFPYDDEFMQSFAEHVPMLEFVASATQWQAGGDLSPTEPVVNVDAPIVVRNRYRSDDWVVELRTGGAGAGGDPHPAYILDR